MPVNERWSLIEYDAPKALMGEICDCTGYSNQQVRDLLIKTGERAGQSLGFSTNPLTLSGSSVRVSDIAGILRVAPRIEIEIAPKFLGLDSDNSKWREDFFFLATLSRHGRLLDSDRLRSRSGERGDLHTLVARSMVDMYWKNHRRPLRTYNVQKICDFALDGEIEPEDILLPGEDGFVQTSMTYNRENAYNSTILSAARSILPNLREPRVIAQLERMIESLLPQNASTKRVSRVSFPSRSKRWKPLYELSIDVLIGFGLTFANGMASAPGYVIDTWRVWEDLLGISLRVGFGTSQIKTQVPVELGTRQRMTSSSLGKSQSAMVRPDIVIYEANDKISFLVDAKYKGNIINGRTRVSESDLYEALAFSKATQCKTIILGYPAILSKKHMLGDAEPFEIIKVDDVKIIGVEIETKGISSIGGLNAFSKRCAERLKVIALS